MKIRILDEKKICKNERKSDVKNNICFSRRKKPFSVGFWGEFLTGNSDKESSHVVGKFSNSKDSQL